MLLVGMGVLTWLYFVSEATRAGAQDRARLTAFYAAEAGVEEVVDYFNHPLHFDGDEPDNYDTQADHPSNYPLHHSSVVPERYGLFEPYILAYAFTPGNEPLLDDHGDLVVTRQTYFQNVNAGSNEAVSITSKVPSFTIDLTDNDRIVFRQPNGNVFARVREIHLVHPADIIAEEGELPIDARVVTKVVSVGETHEGREVSVESYIMENSTFSITSPGAIISRATATFSGNFNVHWGEIWAGDAINLPPNWDVKLPRNHPDHTYSSSQNYDMWFRLRTEGIIRDNAGTKFADGRVSSGFAENPIASDAPNYLIPYHMDHLYRDSNGKADPKLLYRDNLYQNQLLEFPAFSYEDWKEHVVGFGFPYFFTDTDGNIYGTERDPASTNFGEIVQKSYTDWFAVLPSDDSYDELMEKVAFIDSVPVDDNGNPAPKDGNGVPIIDSTYYPRPPSDPAAYLADISISGGSIHTRGALFIAANINMTGQGNPPRWQDVPDVIMPNFDPPPSNERFSIFHNGLLYSWGRIRGGGNRIVYGSVFAEQGFDASGDPEVFFNVRMRDGSWLNLNTSRVRRQLWAFSD